MTYNVFGGTLSLTQSINQSINQGLRISKSTEVCGRKRQIFRDNRSNVKVTQGQRHIVN